MNRPRADWFGQSVQGLRVYDAKKNQINVDGHTLKWGVPLDWPLSGETFYAPDGLMLFQTGVGYLMPGFDIELEETNGQVKKKRKLDGIRNGKRDQQKLAIRGTSESTREKYDRIIRRRNKAREEQKQREKQERAQIAELEEQLRKGQAKGKSLDMVMENISRYQRNSAANEEALKRSRRLDILPMSLDEALETTRILQQVRASESGDGAED